MRLLTVSLLLASPVFAQEVHRLEASTVAQNGGYGGSVLLEDGLAFFSQAGGTTGFVDVVEASTGNLLRTIHDPAAQSGSGFGASLSAQGNLLVVGSPYLNGQSGAAYVFDISTGALLDTLTGDPSQDSRFGAAVAIEGSLLVISEYLLDFGGMTQRGVVHVYDSSSRALLNTWQATDAATTGHFGRSLVVEGTRAAIGTAAAPQVYLLDLLTGAQTILAPAGANISFGSYMDVDGGLLAVTETGNWQMSLFDFATGAPLGVFHGPTHSVFPGHGVAIDGDVIALGAFGSEVLLLDKDDLSIISRVPNPLTGHLFGHRVDLEDGVVVTASGSETVNNLAWAGLAFILGGSQNLGTDYCTTVPNSTGLSGECWVMGGIEASDNFITLGVGNLPPGENVLFVNAPAQGFVANAGGSDGNLCLSGGLGRHQADLQACGADGGLIIDLDLNALPRPTGQPPQTAVMAGQTWNFQAWHRDGASSNFTSATSVTFQ